MSIRTLSAGLSVALIVATGWAGSSAASDSCREWRDEHRVWKTKALCRYLQGAPQRELDAAVFELLQREAYLTSCDQSVQVARGDMVGWRLAGRAPDEFGSAVLDSVLERAGFDIELRSLFESGVSQRSLASAGRRAASFGGAGVPVRTSLVGIALAGLIAAPLVAASALGFGLETLLRAGADGFVAAVDAVGWVLVPQLLLAIAVLGLGLQQLASRAAGLGAEAAPDWLDPAVESALLLGMLGTISGMVTGFVGLSPDELEPGPLVYGLGTALRSSFVGFSIALAGVWIKTRPESVA